MESAISDRDWSFSINCIFWANTPQAITGAATVDHSDLQGGYSGIGNIDQDPKSLARAVDRLGNGSTFGLEYTATIEGKRIAVLHGHLVDRLIESIHSGPYDYVIHGHTHRRRDERIGATRVINPGALGGERMEKRSCAVLDVSQDQLRFIEIES